MKTEMDFDRILTLWDRFDQSSAAVFDLEFQGLKIRWEKGRADVPAQAVTPAGGFPVAAQVSDAAALRAASSAVPAAGFAPQTAKAQQDSAEKEILAPLVGTFYRAASPEEEPFVKVGQRVRKGDVIGIIEAMKLMNEVTADADGIVREIPAENGALVGFHEVLVKLSDDREKEG